MLKYEIRRYQKNGVANTALAALIAAIFFFFWIPFCKLLWPAYMQVGRDLGLRPYIHTDLWVFTQSQLIQWGGALFFYTLYTNKF
jgi:hypothetical protein